MGTKSKNKYIHIVLFIVSIYILALSLLAVSDIIDNKKYIGKDAYFNSYNFKRELMYYFEDIKTLLQESKYIDINNSSENEMQSNEENEINELYDEIKQGIDATKFIKYYIKAKDGEKIYTNLSDVSDIDEYINNKALYSLSFPQKYIEDGYLQPINAWLQDNGFEGKFIILEDAYDYSQFKQDYEYYKSIRERVMKEIIICIFSLIIGLFILVYIIKNKEDSMRYFEKIRKNHERIPIDLRIIIFIIVFYLMLIYLFEINFFYMPIGIRHILKLIPVAIYIFYIILNIKSAFIFLKDEQVRAEQQKNSMIYTFKLSIKESFMIKDIMKNIIVIFILTTLLGMFMWWGLYDVNVGNGFVLGISMIYIFIYFIFVMRYILKNTAMLNKIIKGTNEIVSGNLNYTIEEDGQGNLCKLAHNINNMKDGFKKSVESQVKSERLKSELITNVSHDLKTPLTSIINYIDLLKKEDLSKEEISAYVEVLDRKSQRLKTLIEDLFEASKMASGSVELNIERVDIAAILRQSMGEFDEKIKNSSLDFRMKIPSKHIFLNLDGKKTWRVFENLIGNILKYSHPNTRVFIDLIEYDNKVSVVMKNISAYEMNFDVNEIFERFKRGDKSRNTEGSGLGLAIARSIVELQGGNMIIDIDGDLFKIIVEFNK